MAQEKPTIIRPDDPTDVGKRPEFDGTNIVWTNVAGSEITGPVEMTEQADPAAPAANSARLYVRDNGSGKTQLCVRFATGAVQVLATEP